MKNLLITFFASALLLGFSSLSMAQNARPSKAGQNTAGRNFVDKNNDGICDNVTAGRREYKGRNFVDKNNDSICDNVAAGRREYKGRNFTDKNNDGICDNQGKVAMRNGKGCRYGNHRGNGRR